MYKRCLLVDVCNLVHRIPRLQKRISQGMDLVAEQFLNELRPLHDLENWELHLVVDGKGSRMEQLFVDNLRTLSLVYAPDHLSADTIIESWLIRLDHSWLIRVASEDQGILRTAIANNAEALSTSDLLQWLDRVQHRFRQQQATKSRNPPDSFGNKLEGLP